MTTLTDLINSLSPRNEAPRNYIGASSIGHPCARSIWYSYKNYQRIPFSAKQLRTFEIGKRLEVLIKDKLQEAINICKENEMLHERTLPIFAGTPDAKLIKTWLDENNNTCSKYCILEIKTAKNSSFQQFTNLGLRRWNEQYYAQLQSYMGMSGIHDGYLLALNKDTSDLHDERVGFDDEYYIKLVDKAKMIAEAKTPPLRVSDSPLYYICKQCQFRDICHE